MHKMNNALISEEDSLDWDMNLFEGQRSSLLDLLKFEDSGDEFEESVGLIGAKVSDADDSSTNSSAEKNDEEATLPPKRQLYLPPLPGTVKKKNMKKKRKVLNGPSSRHPSHKKAAGMPKRALSAYNFFFRKERRKIFAQHKQKISFEELGKIVGKRWRSIQVHERKVYDQEAERDEIRYKQELDAYNEARRKRYQKQENTSTPPPYPCDGADAIVTPMSDIKGYAEARAVPLFTDYLRTEREYTSPSPEVKPLSTEEQRDPHQLVREPTVARRVSYDASNDINDMVPPSSYYDQYPPVVPSSPWPLQQQSCYQPNPAPFFSYYPPPPYGYPVALPSPYIDTRIPRARLPSFPDLTRKPSSPECNGKEGEHHPNPPTCMPPPEKKKPRSSAPSENKSSIPSGMEVTIPDEDGKGRRYRVTYNCFRMTRTEAEAYMKSLGQEPGECRVQQD